MYLNFDYTAALIVTTTSLLLFIIVLPFFGKLGDRVGRKPLLLTTFISFLIVPTIYSYFVSQDLSTAIIILQYVMVIILAIASSNAYAFLGELFPSDVRYSGLGISYQFSYALFAGFTPLLLTLLIELFSVSYAPAVFLTIFAIPAVICTLLLKESAFKSLK